MLLKFFKMKTGADEEPGSIRYCLNNPTAKVVRGDPDYVQWVIDHSPVGLRQRFTSGVISNLTKLHPVVKANMLDSLQTLMLGGRHESSMPLCMIDHEDKGKYETHFVAPLYDLMFGKLVHPYIDRIDRNRFAAWVEWFALRHNLEHSNDKLRERPAFHQMRLPKKDVEFLRRIWNMVHKWTDYGSVTCREELEKKFAETPYHVRFLTKANKPLQQPVILGPNGNPLRLTNSIYYRPDYSPAGPRTLDRSDKTAVKKRLDELQRIVKEAMQFRAYHLLGRLFGRKEQEKVKKGKARSRLTKLIAEKRERDIALDGNWKEFSLEQLFQLPSIIEHGIDLPKYTPVELKLEPKVNLIEPSMAAETSPTSKAPQVTPSPEEDQPSPPLVGAPPQPFRPAAQDENMVVSTSKGKALAITDLPPIIAKKKPRKRKQQELEDPQL